MRHASSCSILLALLVGTGCAGTAKMEASAPPAQPPMAQDAMPGGEGPSPSAPAASPAAAKSIPAARTDSSPAAHAGDAKAKSGDEKLTGDHMLVFTGSVDLEVDRGDIASSIDDVVEAAVERGGYIAKQNDKSVTVRVPSKSFRATMRAIEKLGDVMHRGVQAQDVSEEYNDLGVRLKSLRATRARLEKFLDRAKSIQEVLRVEKELSRLNSQIDQLEGRMRYLSQRAAMSTITVAFSAKPVSKKVVVEKSPPPPPAEPKTRPLPIGWISKVGLDHLMKLHTGESR